MTNYLNKTYNWQSADVVAVYDDMPAWSAMPGNALIETISYAPDKTIVDIGFGTGYPLLLLAERFGASCKLYGIDTWEAALKHTQQKAERRGIKNIALINADAAATTLGDAVADIITSNLGINNFANPDDVVKECYRMLKPNGELYLSSNLTGTFKEFYDEFEQVLKQFGGETLPLLNKHINSRATTNTINALFAKQGFTAKQHFEKSYTLTYANGSAFLNDYFIVMAFLPTWKEIILKEHHTEVFSLLEERLNQKANKSGGLKLTIPYGVYKFIKA